jgi:hypothetical protein
MENSQRAILAPLLGLGFGWVLFMFAAWSNLFIQPEYDTAGNYLNAGASVQPSTYLYLGGIALYSLGAFLGLRIASRQRSAEGPGHPLTLAAYRLGNLAVIIGLASAAIFAMANFLGAFGDGGTDSLTVRIFAVYIPIVLSAALVVGLLLLSFVYRGDPGDADSLGVSARQRALGWGYAVPILAAAAAIVFGLTVYDVTGTSLDAWIWVIIQVLIAAGIILGTRFARRARAEIPSPPKPRTALASGAWNLNFVLSIVFGGVVSIMAFVFGSAAFEKLRDYNFDYEGWEIRSVTVSWIVADFAPAIMLIALVIIGLYAAITERHRDEARR